jgi:hypothetical protein
MMLCSACIECFKAHDREREALMPERGWIQAHPWVTFICRLLGLGVFVLAFFLPAVSSPEPGATVFPGWKCASIALTEINALFGKAVTGTPSFEVILVVLSGWINLLIALVLCCSFSRKLVILRRILGGLILICMGATWMFFSLEKVSPLIGHYLWIAGALLILAPDAIGGKRKPAEAGRLPSKG